MIRANDTLYCFGQHALDDTAPTLGRVTAVASGSNFDCVTKPDKLVHCFGDNAQGQTNSPRGIGSASFIASSNDHACAIEEDQTLDRFGDETSEAGIPSIDPTVKVKWAKRAEYPGKSQSPLSHRRRGEYLRDCLGWHRLLFWPKQVRGGHHCPIWPFKGGRDEGPAPCMIQANDLAKCIGREPFTGVFNIPATVGPVKSIATGSNMTCMIKADDTVFCAVANRIAPPPPDLGQVKALAVDFHGCTIRMDNTLRCWHQFGNNGDPTPPADLGQVIAVSAGARHSCAVKTNGRVVCWGAIPNNIPATLQ